MNNRFLIILFILFFKFSTFGQYGATFEPYGGRSATELYYEADEARMRKDYEKAFILLTQARSLDPNNNSVLNSLGYLYEKVFGNYNKAVEHYTRSANGGNTHAMLNLGRIYYEGKIVPQNYQEAIKWYHKAADYESGIAMYNLGYLYLMGKGTPKNKDMAIYWYKAAAAKGLPVAKEALEILEKGRYFFIF